MVNFNVTLQKVSGFFQHSGIMLGQELKQADYSLLQKKQKIQEGVTGEP